MLACVCLGIGALALRTVQVQLLDGGSLARAAEAQQRVAVPIWAPRGAIVDRTGQPLALSYEAVTVGVWPSRIPDRRAFAQALSQYTRVTPAVIEQRMGGSAQYVFAVRPRGAVHVDADQAGPHARPAGQGAGDRAAAGAAAHLSQGRPRRPGRRSRRRRALRGRARAQRRAERARRPGVRLEGQRPPRRRPALGARAARARAGAGQERAADARPAHPAARAAGDRRDPREVARQGRHGRRARHPDGRHPGDGRRAGSAAVRLSRRQPRRVASARDHRPLRARLDVQARDVHGRPAGGQDHAQHAVRRPVHLQQVRPHDRGCALPHGRRALDGARDPRALLERRHDHDRRPAPR